ncbi:hypothetical protein PSECIP111951_02531 [Pseudoalteromonas holothuriae]|uniref:DUF3718 domain-containing protein n=1 Tax=Pseudoalteromonas holothuriae TaxID=2963714 RepID=A0A9W4W5P0_9GAMM|nr:MULTISPECIES: DUF3718 domain-containing protein [unclassified Pseudoalteromonas]CAH9061643.1 hypothetical protein PSECIP111951_02531 [Pseudoalteromonas sp. CIP111951]CAH9061931.1 hypothetical protein PSECIP111854_02911 [Pseudoalteromonas sp. CIP111854]
MKKLTTFCASATLLASLLTATAHAEQFVAADNTIETNLCMAITENDSYNLRRTMREYRIGLRVVQNELSCNNMSTDQFISKHGLDNSAHSLRFDMNTETHIKDLSASANNLTILVSGS